MTDHIERGPLLEAFKAKCCEDCPGGYDRAKCQSWCDAADEIALVMPRQSPRTPSAGARPQKSRRLRPMQTKTAAS